MRNGLRSHFDRLTQLEVFASNEESNKAQAKVAASS